MSAPITTLVKADSKDLPALVVAELPSLAITTISGEDRLSYLQGQTTCDLNQLKPNHYVFGAQCDFKGKMWSIFRIFADADRLFMLHNETSQSPAVAELKKFAAFSKVAIANDTPNWHCFGIAGSDAATVLSQTYSTLPDANQPVQNIAEGYLLFIPAPVPRYLMMVQKSAVLPAPLQAATQDSEQLWLLLDIEAGLPQLNGPLIQQYVPQMLNLQALDGISFKKGCYIGQETVARMRYLGKNKRAMFLLSGQFEGDIDPGAELELAINDSWRRIGVVVTAVSINGTGKLLAILPIDSEESAHIRLKEQPNSSLRLQPLPYSLNPEA
jgi:folate-binding protein YgfZ